MAGNKRGTRFFRVPWIEERRSGAHESDSQGGFSLIEVAVSISLLGVLAVATLLTIIPLSRQTRINRELEAASAAARDVLERVQSTPFNDIATLYPDGQTITVSTLEGGQVEVAYSDAAADPLQMQLTMTWTSPDLGPMARTFETVKTE